MREGAQGILEAPRRGPGRPRKFTDEQLLELHGEGLSDAEVGRRLGVSRTTVRYWRLKLGLEPNRRPPRKRARPRVSAERIKLLNAQGLNDVQIAERLGVTPSTVGYWRRRLGIPAARWVRMAMTEGEILDIVRSEGAIELRTLLPRVRGRAPYVRGRAWDLISRGEVRAVRLRLGRGMHGGPFSGRGAVVLYRDDEALAEYLGERLGLSPDLPERRRAVLTHYLRGQLPREVFERVHGLYSRKRR